MLSGKAVSRSQHVHYMVDAALGIILVQRLTTASSEYESLQDFNLSSDNITNIFSEYQTVVTNGLTDTFPSTSLLLLDKGLTLLKSELIQSSLTAKLWLQYMNYVSILKQFIQAERTGNMKLHLSAVSKMLTLFAGTGHNMYTKCARLYLQQIKELCVSHPWLYQQFMEHGYHVVRLSDRYWAGLSTDSLIEVKLMRSIKGRGGLTHGSGVTENVRLVWTETLYQCAAVHSAMQSLTKMETDRVSDHVDISKARSVVISWMCQSWSDGSRTLILLVNLTSTCVAYHLV